MTDGETRKLRVKQIDLVATCSHCAKPISELRNGSLTAWVFRPNFCTCVSKDPDAPTSASKPVAVVDKPDIGERFQIEELIGRGGMGDVFKAKASASGDTVAIKVLRKDLASDSHRVRCFEREIKAAIDLDHPNLAAVFDYGTTADGIPYSVMEYVPGLPIDEAAPGDGLFLDATKAIDIFLQICEGLSHAHARGIVHLDLKPSNILRCKKNEVDIVKILDFGIARVLTGDTKQELSDSDEVVGSLPYMSPEQLNGEGIDFRSDIYSLGCLMYEVLTGQVPFDADNAVKIVMNHLDGLPHGFTSQFKRMDVPRGLEKVIRHCLERNPSLRYQCVEELIADLEMVRDGGNPVIAQRQLQLQRKDQELISPNQKKVAIGVAAISVVAYMFNLSHLDTFRQAALMVQLIYCSGLVAVSAKVFLFARPYLAEINGRLKASARAWVGDRWLQSGLYMLMCYTVMLSGYSVALLLWYNGIRGAFLNWLIVPNETFLVLVVSPAISLLMIFIGLWRKSSSMRSDLPVVRSKKSQLIWASGALVSLYVVVMFPTLVYLALPAVLLSSIVLILRKALGVEKTTSKRKLLVSVVLCYVAGYYGLNTWAAHDFNAVTWYFLLVPWLAIPTVFLSVLLYAWRRPAPHDRISQNLEHESIEHSLLGSNSQVRAEGLVPIVDEDPER